MTQDQGQRFLDPRSGPVEEKASEAWPVRLREPEAGKGQSAGQRAEDAVGASRHPLPRTSMFTVK